MIRAFFQSILFVAFLTNHLFAGEDTMNTNPVTENTQEAIFAMGCFWCGVAAFSDHDTNVKYPGIIDVKAGYTGGDFRNPTYENHEGHKEAVKVIFDPKIISYEQLLDIFWKNIDPFDAKGQFCDKGFPYTSAIFYKNDDEQKLALASKENYEKVLGKPFQTEIIQASAFYDAEEYHQDYKIKNPVRYSIYRWNCGRDMRLKEVWSR